MLAVHGELVGRETLADSLSVQVVARGAPAASPESGSPGTDVAYRDELTVNGLPVVVTVRRMA